MDRSVPRNCGESSCVGAPSLQTFWGHFATSAWWIMREGLAVPSALSCSYSNITPLTFKKPIRTRVAGRERFKAWFILLDLSHFCTEELLQSKHYWTYLHKETHSTRRLGAGGTQRRSLDASTQTWTWGLCFLPAPCSQELKEHSGLPDVFPRIWKSRWNLAAMFLGLSAKRFFTVFLSQNQLLSHFDICI